MRIGIDARFWGTEHTGIGRYVMELVSCLEKIDRENEYLIFLRKKYFNQLNFTNSNFKKRLADIPHYSFAEQISFTKVLHKERLDLVHFPHFNIPILYRGKFVLTVHDLIKHQSKGPSTTTHSRFFYWLKFIAYLAVINIGLRRAQAIIVPSFWWQDRLKRKFGLSERRIKVIYEAVSQDFKKPIRSRNKKLIDQVLEKYQIRSPFVIYTGNLYPHKNIIRLVEVIRMINQKRTLFLVIVCGKSIFWRRFKKEIEETSASEFVFLTGFIPDKELTFLYQAASAFVFPSLLEGFGLPGLEAMAVGLPVIASRASCLPEIYQGAAYYFDPTSSDDIKTKILEVLENRKLRVELIKKGYRRVKDFSWEKMAQETREIYQTVIKIK